MDEAWNKIGSRQAGTKTPLLPKKIMNRIKNSLVSLCVNMKAFHKPNFIDSLISCLFFTFPLVGIHWLGWGPFNTYIYNTSGGIRSIKGVLEKLRIIKDIKSFTFFIHIYYIYFIYIYLFIHLLYSYCLSLFIY